MSENLDLVRSIYANWERGDFRSGEWADPEIEFSVVDGAVGMSGPGETAQFIRDIWSVWDDYRVMADKFRELDDERVLVLVHTAGVGRTSGVDIGRVHKGGANLFHLRNGKVTRFELYWDRDRALADLGLEE
jgi:ketosteroid isomerase-like protein